MVRYLMRVGGMVTAAWTLMGTATGCGGETAGTDISESDPDTEQPLSVGLCGGQNHRECDAGDVCLPFFSLRCLEPDEIGICVRKPSYCLPISNPVCGCDGTSYPNICEALKAGTTVADVGVCPEPEEPECAGGDEGPFCAGDGTCVDDAGMACDRTDPDCVGMCVCKVVKKCSPREVWDLDPAVCGCIPAPADACDNVECPDPERTQCVVNDDGSTSCEPIGEK